MGYDGPGSRSMDSEPVHKVGVTSFYISESFVTSNIVSEVSKKKSRNNFYITTWKNANELVEGVASKTGLPVRLPLETEWEYAACSPEQDKIFEKCKGPEYCYDYFDNFKDTEYRIDPKGPIKGKSNMHVFRAYFQKKGKLCRNGGSITEFNFRLVVKAKDVIDKIN